MDPNQNDQTQNPSTANQEVSAQPPPEPTAPPPPSPHKELDTHSLIAILLLVFVYPIGLIFMWFMTKWPRWVKILVSLPIPLALLGLALTTFLAVKDPFNKLDRIPTPTPAPIRTSTPTPTPIDEAASWSIYTNSGNNYSIKYPIQWEVTSVEEEDVPGSECIFLGKKKEINELMTGCFILEKFSAVYPEVPSDPSYSKTTINNYIAYKRNSATASLDADIYILSSDGSFMALSQSTLPDKELFEKVVSTFKFTE